MSRSRKDGRRRGGHGRRAKQGKEYWASRLCPGGETPGRWTKTMTHRKERREGKPSEDQA